MSFKSPKIIVLIALALTVALLSIIYFAMPSKIDMDTFKVTKKAKRSPFMTSSAAPDRSNVSTAEEKLKNVEHSKGQALSNSPDINFSIQGASLPKRPASLK